MMTENTVPEDNPSEIGSIFEENTINDDLENFRQEWKTEVSQKFNKDVNKTVKESNNSNQTNHAKKLFQQGIECERDGNMHSAIHFYRKAVQLDPEVEQYMENSSDFNLPHDDQPDIAFTENEIDLVAKFNLLSFKQISQCVTSTLSGSHIPALEAPQINIVQLPSEILNWIFRWVISSDMDMVSLNILSETCRKFYLHARDPIIWHAACKGVWGLSVSNKGYLSWRDMYIERPHVHLDGVYISKVAYFRQGDPTVFSIYYKPFQCVEYYRYIRFFGNGQVIFYTTPEEPAQVISKLTFDNAQSLNFRVGQYKSHTGNQSPQRKLKSAIISAILTGKTKENPSSTNKSRNRANKSENKYIITTTEYQVELELTSTSSRKRFNKLSWLNYSGRFTFGDTGRISETQFDLHDQYPPFYFSRVKSYNNYSFAPL